MADYQSISVDFVDRPRTQVTKDRAYTLTAKLFLDGTQDVVASGTITILKPGGGAMDTAVSGEAVSVDGNGTCTYSLVAGNTGELNANYSAQWILTDSNGDVHEVPQLFDVVRYPLRNMVVQADLVKHHQDLADALFSGQSNFQDDIELAFEDVYAGIERKGKRPYLILSSEDMRRPTEHLTLFKIFASRRKEEGDRWDVYAQYHWDRYHAWMEGAVFVYDEDETGTADGTSSTSTLEGEEARGLGIRWKV